MASTVLDVNWAPLPLQINNRNRNVVLNLNSMRLTSTNLRSPVVFLRFNFALHCYRFRAGARKQNNGGVPDTLEENKLSRVSLQALLWAAESVYILWLFLLPYAPGDPVWAIKLNTIKDLIGLSLNFFFILPLANLVGIHVIQEPVLHPVAESLFNFVIGWTFLFAPLIFTDRLRGRFKGSLDLLWGFQMFLTNTFLIPYMAIRLNDGEKSLPKPSRLGLLMTTGARVVAIIGGIVCFLSIIWALFGRADGGFGDVRDRWQFLKGYVGSERLAYAFVWDIFLYAVFQPWLIGDNLKNVKSSDEGIVGVLRYVPVFGLVAYLLCLDIDDKEF